MRGGVLLLVAATAACAGEGRPTAPVDTATRRFTGTLAGRGDESFAGRAIFETSPSRDSVFSLTLLSDSGFIGYAALYVIDGAGRPAPGVHVVGPPAPLGQRSTAPYVIFNGPAGPENWYRAQWQSTGGRIVITRSSPTAVTGEAVIEATEATVAGAPASGSTITIRVQFDAGCGTTTCY